MTKRKSISSRVRTLIFERDNYRCRMCGRSADEVTLEVDHIFPHTLGGTDDLNNLATLCRDCNRGKSDLLLQNLLKKKVEEGDLSPIGSIILTVNFNKLKIESELHEYELIVDVLNETGKTIANPQLEVKLPRACILVNSGGEVSGVGEIVTILFPKLDINKIHPKQSVKLMTTANVGLYYKMTGAIYWNDRLRNSEFVVTLYGDDTQPTVFKKPFEGMQIF